jgi:hypothetical protein
MRGQPPLSEGTGCHHIQIALAGERQCRADQRVRNTMAPRGSWYFGVLEVENTVAKVAVDQLALTARALSHEAVVRGIVLNGHTYSNRFGQLM